MSTGISSSDIVAQWSLSFADTDFINSKPAATRLGVSIRRVPQVQPFFRDRRFHFAARASTFLRRLAASTSPGS